VKLFLTSVGSRVGQHILDVLEYPGFSRRSLVEVVATNSLPDAACNFRCDRCYLVPLTAAAEYPARMQDILRDESPDLILCGRDEDTYALSQLKSQHPELPGALPLGPPRTALIGLDKWQTWLFARKHRLPFAESFMPGQSGDGAALDAFCGRVGYPLIAKPTRGAASRGVCFIRDTHDAQAVAQRPGYMFQEYVGDPRSLEPYFAILQGPPPLFAHFAKPGYHVCHTVISRSGDITPIAVTENHVEYGHTTLNRRILDPLLDALTVDYARALFLEGVAGPMAIQIRQDRDGDWKVLEINLRPTGGTLARFLRGIDELYFIIRAFVDTSFPELHPYRIDGCEQVVKQYYSYPVFDSDVLILKRSGVWCRS
jgi:glutathione synthase/RimK-type ligase-like ATP-grasp enzyme